ncbi:transcriptional regulator, TetR family [Sphingomonas sp. NFR04]|uniref:TetR/AcrR family transcriptional regulator n=1 Tax=Sphingomonas sp. NFR04 TaxID=1566283 RepID=UPI0008E5D4C2|nr:TetR/AcrR family transcriptional regulator [Sphingomonas sp. NFR04]SFJ32048.1 transcriptional regulator, TetR family [Sphingomonas sp. NFR04]
MAEATEAGGAPHRDKALLRREKIVSAARRLFIANGFHATGVAQIAKESGIAIGQIYRDFSSKEAIVKAIVHADCREFLAHESLRQGIERNNPEAVWVWLREFLDSQPDEADPLFAEILAESARNARVAAIFEEVRDEVREAMLAALAALAPGNAFGERRSALANLVLATSLGLKQHRFLNDPRETQCAADLALKMIQAEIAAMRAEQGGD